MWEWLANSISILVALLLVALNGFFVAAEFALVKVRGSRLDEMVRHGRPFAKIARWLYRRMDRSLSACQLGITMASLGLGWIAEPAFAIGIRAALAFVGIHSPELVHGIAFVVAFMLITSLHLVLGEQAPKIFAIRRPEAMTLWCAAPLMFFYILLYPLLSVLSSTTTLLLRMVGVDTTHPHERPHSEAEIRALLHQAHTHGELTRSEHRLLDAVFEFDDMICRRVMVPRKDVVVFDVNQTLADCLLLARRTKHTRYPLCDGSLDTVLGVVHIKDLVGIDPDTKGFDLQRVMRPPRKVPETLPISRVLREFQATHQLMAFVVDEHGTIVGIVTLENVLEEIVGPVDDEFDVDQPNIVPSGPDEFLVMGNTPIKDVEIELGLNLDDQDVDTVSGVLVSRAQHLLAAGETVQFDGASAEVLEVKDGRALKIRFRLHQEGDESPHSPS